MIDAQTIPDNELRTTTRMVRDEALSRGWRVWCYEGSYSHLRLERPGKETIEIYSAAPPTTTYAAGLASKNKYMITCLLKDNGIPVPETYLLRKDEIKDEVAASYFERNIPLVVKPLDSGHGNGVTVNITNLEKYREAIQNAREFSHELVVQECVSDAIDIRVTCIDYKMVGAVIRVPGRVKGDGIHTVKELILQENQNLARGENYQKPLNFLSIDKAEIFLGKDIQSVPAENQYIQVVGTANLGTGGEIIDCTDDLPSWLVEWAEKVAKISQLPVCGVDFLLKKYPVVTDSKDELRAYFIETNSCPSLFLNEEPLVPKSRGVIGKYVDYLDTL